MARDHSCATRRKKKQGLRYLDDDDIEAVLGPVAPRIDHSVRLKLREEINWCIDTRVSMHKISDAERIKKAQKLQKAAVRFYKLLLEEMWSGCLAHEADQTLEWLEAQHAKSDTLFHDPGRRSELHRILEEYLAYRQAPVLERRTAWRALRECSRRVAAIHLAGGLIEARLHRIRQTPIAKKAGWWNGDGARYWFVKSLADCYSQTLGKPPTLTRDGNWVFFLAGTLSRCESKKVSAERAFDLWKKVKNLLKAIPN